ncbi:MAG TPA: protein phosphatase 2C domain-containing protein [Bryobacteraceae bacterium]|nr:protein phosphatase 2C domain-containing protein [Bryobacteraceae bacterium]
MILIPGNAQHIGSRQQQQDAFGFSNLANEAFRKHAGMLAVVADGMGGMANGDAASRCALKAFLQAYESKTEAEDIPDALLRAIHKANSAVYQLALEMGSADDMGTTLVAVAVKNDRMHWISAGDSAIFLYRDSEFTALNAPHIYGAELDEKVSQGAMTRADAMAHPEREALTSFLGMERLSVVDRSIRALALREHDVILLASDGLFKTLSLDQMAEAMQGDAQEMSEALVNRTIAAAKQHQDNVTVVAISAEKPKPSLAAAGPAKQRVRKRALLPILLAVAALLVAGSYLYYMFSSDSRSKGTIQQQSAEPSEGRPEPTPRPKEEQGKPPVEPKK